MRSVLLLLILSLVLPCLESSAQEWTRFRGPNGSRISPATNIPLKWTADDYNREIDLPVQGSSSPVLWAKRLFLMGDEFDDGQRSLLLLTGYKFEVC